MGPRIDTIPQEILLRLSQWHRPGSVRQLENFIKRSVVLSQGPALCAPLATMTILPMALNPAPAGASGAGAYSPNFA